MKKFLILNFLVLFPFILSCTKFELLTNNENNHGLIDGLLINAKFDNPEDLTVDERNGNLYVLDQQSKAIRKISLNSNVTTFLTNKDIDAKKEDYKIKGIKIKDNYLYFGFDYSIKRINLDEKLNIENFIGSGKEGEKDGNFKDTEFFAPENFSFFPNGNIFIDDHKRIKIADIKKQETKNQMFGVVKFQGIQLKDNSYETFTKFIMTDINSKTENIFILNDNRLFSLTNIYEIDKNNNIEHSNLESISKITSSFTFDSEGNAYIVSGNHNHILKVDLKNNIEIISSLIGVLDIEKDYSGDIIVPRTDITIDNKRKILYMSVPEANKIFKVGLK